MYKKLNNNGYILAAVIAISLGVALFAIALSTMAVSQFSRTTQELQLVNANQVAEAGIEESVLQLNSDGNFLGYTSDQVFFNNNDQGKGIFTTTITSSADSNAKFIVSTGKIYKYNSTKLLKTRQLKVTVVGTGSSGYSVFSGPGGLILGGSANITTSDVYVNGILSLSGTASIGANNKPVNVNVAYQSCPTGNNPGPTYPSVCTTGEPISLAQSTFIYGTVCATRQTSKGPNNNIKPGVGGEGLKPGCIAPPVTTPVYDKTAQVAAVTTTATGTSNTYVCNSYPFTRNWPDKLKLTGNVSIGSSCDITINGDVYITGNLTLGGAAKIRVADSLGTRRPYVVVDGTIDVGGSAQTIANSQGTGIQFVSNKATASCNPNCTNLAGNDLKNSQGVQVISVGGGVSLPGMVFQANWGKLTLAGSGSVGAAIGQTVDMSGAGNVTFGTKLSTAGQKTWSITSYQQL